MWLRKYDNYMGVKTQRSWIIYKDKWIEGLTKGFINFETHLPVMSVKAALRYLHTNGIPQNYKLRQLRKDLTERGYLLQKKGNFPDRVTRSHLNKMIGEWNGVR